MSDLPNRDDIRALLEAKPTDYGTALAAWIELQIMLKDELLGQWLDGRLKTRDEMDEEAAIRELMRWHGEDVTWQFWWQAIRDAACGGGH